MEFRIAPMIMVIFNLCFITLANPDLNAWIPLKYLADYPKVLIPFGLLLFLSLGTYFRHAYFSRPFRLTYWLMQAGALGMLIYYVLAVQAQHL